MSGRQDVLLVDERAAAEEASPDAPLGDHLLHQGHLPGPLVEQRLATAQDSGGQLVALNVQLCRRRAHGR